MRLAAGCTVPEAAFDLGRSPHTVKKQCDSIRRKLGARTQAHMVALAYERGLLRKGSLNRIGDAICEARWRSS